MMLETSKINKEWHKVEKRAVRVRAFVSRLRESPEMTEDTMLQGVLEDVRETHQRAQALVQDYRQRSCSMCRYCEARKLTKRLRRAHQDILCDVMRAILATNATVFISPPAVDHKSCPYLGLFLPTDDNASTGAAVSSDPDCSCCPCCRPHVHDQVISLHSLSELEAATDGFSEEKIIGRGGSGSIVFKAVLDDKLIVAIEKFQDPAESLVACICNELHLASELHHMVEDSNIIRILGYGHKVIRKHDLVETSIFLVREFMVKGKMDTIIYGSPHDDWSSRFRIIKGIAYGIDYLHGQGISHLDLKPTNILFDSDMNPKITGFGRGRKLNKTSTQDDSITGTIGYMPPEYILDGTISTKYDVYSFGVILLETISGMCRPESAPHKASVEWAWEAHEAGRRMGDLLDQSLCRKEGQLEEVRRCLKIGLLCAQEKPADRPAMLGVRLMLRGDDKTTKPTRPEYTKSRHPHPRHDGVFSCCF
ncbi:unnamed protein product [Urochloa decumbens]|uniref:Protein kinase domain-containing protein n=1 Tax=Urochloa decumbens TaxID=240449 RepID=A0ABC9AU52_9POAL